MPTPRVQAAAEGMPNDNAAELQQILETLTRDELSAIHALTLALLDDADADHVAAMAPHVGQEKAEAVHQLALGLLAVRRAA